MYMILDPWFNLIRVIVVIISNTDDLFKCFIFVVSTES